MGLKFLLKTELFGDPIIDKYINNNILIYKFLSWSIMLFQSTFFLSLINENFLIAYLVLGLFFHLFIAFTFKLYDFLISFISSYPILVYTFYYFNASI